MRIVSRASVVLSFGYGETFRFETAAKKRIKAAYGFQIVAAFDIRVRFG
jgi:hypothetical protein